MQVSNQNFFNIPTREVKVSIVVSNFGKHPFNFYFIITYLEFQLSLKWTFGLLGINTTFENLKVNKNKRYILLTKILSPLALILVKFVEVITILDLHHALTSIKYFWGWIWLYFLLILFYIFATWFLYVQNVQAMVEPLRLRCSNFE